MANGLPATAGAQRSATRTALFLVGVGAMACAPVVAGALAFRSIGEAGRGELAVYVVVGTIAGLVGARGLEMALLSQNVSSADSLGLAAFVNRRLLGIAVLEAPVAALVAVLIVGQFDVVACLAVWAFTVASADYSLSKALNLRERRTALLLAIDLAVALLTVGASVVVWATEGRAAAYTVGLALALVSASVLTRTCVRARRAIELRGLDEHAIRAVARPLFVSKGFVVIAFRIDRILLAVIVGLSGAGIYAAAIPVAEIVGMTPLHLAQLSTVDLAADRSVRWWRTMPALVGFAISACVLIVVVVLSDALLDALYDSSSDTLTRTVRILAMASFMSGLWRLAEAELVANGRARATVLPAALAAGAVAVVTATLANRLGAVAAALGSLVGYSIAFVVTAVATSRSAPRRLADA